MGKRRQRQQKARQMPNVTARQVHTFAFAIQLINIFCALYCMFAFYFKYIATPWKIALTCYMIYAVWCLATTWACAAFTRPLYVKRVSELEEAKKQLEPTAQQQVTNTIAEGPDVQEEKQEVQVPPTNDVVVNDASSNSQLFCKVCGPRPLGAYHCSVCRRCVVRLDHHCVWSQNCICPVNHYFFLKFAFWVAMSQAPIIPLAIATFKFTCFSIMPLFTGLFGATMFANHVYLGYVGLSSIELRKGRKPNRDKGTLALEYGKWWLIRLMVPEFRFSQLCKDQ